MKYILYLISIIFILASCKERDSVVISKDEYKKLTNDTILLKYPKKIKINYLDGYRTFDVYLGTDGHEYQEHLGGYMTSSQWIHYGDCEKCNKRFNLETKTIKQSYIVIWQSNDEQSINQTPIDVILTDIDIAEIKYQLILDTLTKEIDEDENDITILSINKL